MFLLDRDIKYASKEFECQKGWTMIDQQIISLPNFSFGRANGCTDAALVAVVAAAACGFFRKGFSCQYMKEELCGGISNGFQGRVRKVCAVS